MTLLILLFLAFLPTIFWFVVFLHEEKFDPIPKRLITKIFIFGGLSAVVAIIINLVVILPLPDHIRTTFFNLEKVKTLGSDLAIIVVVLTILLAFIEEIIKIFAVKIFAYKDPRFNQVVDGAVLGVSAALGFATLENLFYFFEALEKGVAMLIVVFILRFLATTLLHATATGISGYFLGKEKFTGEKGVFFKGLFAAMLTHATFNLFLLGGLVGIILELVFLVTMFTFLLRRMESAEAQTIWKLIPFRRPYSSSSLTGSSNRL